MLSNSRIYIFKISYKGKEWISSLDANELSSLLANIIKTSIKDLKIKDIKIINSYRSGIYSSEIHIDKLKYRERRILSKEQISELRKILRQQLRKINEFTYEQIHIVNDEFTRKPTEAFLTEDSLHV